MASDLTKKLDGNSLDSIAESLGIDSDHQNYAEFDRLRKNPCYKVIGIMGMEFIWIHKICGDPSEAIELAENNNLDLRSRQHNPRVIFCACDKEGNYTGGLEFFTR